MSGRDAGGRFLPGVSGNATGRTSGAIVTSSFAAVAALHDLGVEADDAGRTRWQRLATVLWDAALKGDPRSTKLLLDYAALPASERAAVELNERLDELQRLVEEKEA